MAQPNRLPSGGRIDRSHGLRFSFDGESYLGYRGDTLASALLANGVDVVGRSFKYHRPRGIYSAGVEEPNALVTLGEGEYAEPNSRATMVELHDGLTAFSQNNWPSLRHDLLALNGWAARLLPAGFYYKTFMWPRAFWHLYESVIRRAAGPAPAPKLPDPERYEHRHAHCDILVVGGGPAGLMAATAAARAGLRVMVLDEQALWGGSLLADPAELNNAPAEQWVADRVSELSGHGDCRMLARTTVVGYHDYNYLIALERLSDHLPAKAAAGPPRQRLWKIRARRVLLATGAIERPLLFPGGDRPGVMLSGAVLEYINRYGVLPGRKVAFVVNNDVAYRAAATAAVAGAEVTLVDVRPNPAGPLVASAREHGVDVVAGHWVADTSGRGKIEGLELAAVDGGIPGARRRLDCDLVAVSGGLMPNVQLFSQARGKLAFDEGMAAFVPGLAAAINPLRSAGGCNGVTNLVAAFSDGAAAATALVRDLGYHTDMPVSPTAISAADRPVGQIWPPPPGLYDDARESRIFVDLASDVTVADVRLAAREGYLAVEHLKRYTTAGMGADQGKTSNLNTLLVLADARGVAPADAGHTTFRPMYTPVAFGAIAGLDARALFEPARTTAIHPWHRDAGAVFEDVGDWKRPYYYPRAGEDMAAAVARETLAVRQSVGVIDASTLGKIDIRGPDALALLNMVYTNLWDTLALRQCRYGLMLDENGMVFDDGVTARLADDHFHMTTTTGNAARVLGWLEEWLQTEWPDLRVYCTSVTEQWAVAALNGPNSRAVLAKLSDIDLDDDAFPFMAVREGSVAGLPARVFRISFAGAQGYEINVPAGHGLELWHAVMAAGAEFDICPYGTEAMHILRAEKGFIIAGQDSDGTVTPDDLGLGRMVSKKKDDFLGRRSLFRADTARPGRKQLVGLLSEDPDTLLPEGSHIVAGVKPKPPMAMLGHVTSSYRSPNLGRTIALALLADGRARHGQTMSVQPMHGPALRARVVAPAFLPDDGAPA
jgi:sarcosine oxidase subunit alpha